MILSKQDYKDYIEADRIVNHVTHKGMLINRLRGG